MAISSLRVNHLDSPIGLHTIGNVFSFLSDEAGPFKASLYRNGTLVESKTVSSSESPCFAFSKPFEPSSAYRVEVHAEGLATLDFETAPLLQSPLIVAPKGCHAPIFRKRFSLTKKVTCARLAITGLGLYRAFINDIRIGKSYLTPGYNDYDAYLRYQTYEVTNLQIGENLLDIHMGDGWYKGRFGIDKPIEKGGNIFGEDYKLCLCLHLRYEDGTEETIESDDSFEVYTSTCLANSIYDGEIRDYRKQETKLGNALIVDNPYRLTPDFGSPIAKVDSLKPELYISPKGERILDFKQNMVGFVSYKGIQYLRRTVVL